MIRASEIGDYVYCARSWWLRRVVGEEPEGQERRDLGTALHARHSRGLTLSRLALWAGLLALLAGITLFLLT